MLGASEAQLVSTQDGLVSLIPELAYINGACDVFITAAVSSSPSSTKMQFHMQVLTTMGGGGQQNKRAPAPARTEPLLRPRTMMNR